MMRRTTTIALTTAACSFALLASVARPQAASPTTAPVSNLPSGAGASKLSTEDLRAQASKAFEANEYATALPLLKDLSVRLRDKPDEVASLLEKVRVCEKNLGNATPVVEGINAPRTPHPAIAPGQTYAVELQKLGNFNYDAEKGGNIPADVQALTGSTLKLHGYMLPIDQSDRITKFVLVPSLFACCFGQPPSIQHTVYVDCPTGKAVSYYPDQVSVVGTLTVKEQKEDGYITNIFEMTASSIKPMQQ